MDIIREWSCCTRGAGANLVASASDQAKLNHSPPRILQSPQGALSPPTHKYSIYPQSDHVL